ncbi:MULTISPECIES: phosphatase PAP2 family protein [unclassified Geobacillus]|uniref:phosphatase PAP2 family protein n=1 Tax=unclassified Geobacillus TaxID=2642459 RepID=UPI000BE30802|nr:MULTISPECIES: phosphatase PAP2 family protein [unclassified Geobacillus]PDM40531.1 phosphatase PAP2 family protein [Parageobacillus yumthangensis]PUF89147.1 PAP2 family protein [Geobacillus sp. LYN3]RDV21426.1 PAP2 family protein [Parageobacillus toebii]TXK87093.1 phosphatase PAP2 family protein [Geobacillus sp. AYS3]
MNKCLLSVSALSFLLFLAIWAAVASGATNEIDERLLQMFDSWDWLDGFTILGYGYFIGIASILLVLFLWLRKRDYYGMVLVLVAVGGGYGLNTFIKDLVGRARPPFAQGVHGFSFPSGHAMVGSIYLLLIAYFLSKEVKKASQRWAIFFIFGLLALLTGLSRLSLQVHYPSDVLAGFLLACAYLSLCVAVYQRLKRNFPRVSMVGMKPKHDS